MKKNKLQGVIIYFLIAILLIFGLVYMLNLAGNRSGRNAPNYSDVIAEFDNLNVSAYELDLGSGALRYYLKGTEKDTQKMLTYSVPNVNVFLNDINSGYNDAGKPVNYRIRYNEANPNAPLVENYIPISDNTFLTTILPYLLLVGDDHFHVYRDASDHGRREDEHLLPRECPPAVGQKSHFQ